MTPPPPVPPETYTPEQLESLAELLADEAADVRPLRAGMNHDIAAALRFAAAALRASAVSVDRSRVQDLIARWREQARRVRPLEDAPVTPEKRAATREWMFYTMVANELSALLASSAAPAQETT